MKQIKPSLLPLIILTVGAIAFFWINPWSLTLARLYPF